MHHAYAALSACLVLLLPASARAEWQAATPEVALAAQEPGIAAVLAAVTRMDDALVTDDHAAFAALLAADLVVNNPQNGVSQAGGTARRNAGGQISYASYNRTIEFAGRRGGMVVLMGGEVVVPRGADGVERAPVRRRFTDLWQQAADGWRLAVRQATIIP